MVYKYIHTCIIYMYYIHMVYRDIHKCIIYINIYVDILPIHVWCIDIYIHVLSHIKYVCVCTEIDINT